MNKQELSKKIDNFWFYYKWHVIVGIFVVIIASVTIYDAVTKIHPDLIIDCVTDSNISHSHTPFITDDLEASGFVKDNNDDGNIAVQMTHTQTGRDPSTVSADGSMMQVVQLRMAVGESSLIITEPYILELYDAHEIFYDLTEIADKMGIPRERRHMSEDGSKVTAINIDNTEFLSKLNIPTKDCFVAVRVLNLNQQDDEEKIKQFENAKEIMEYIAK